ncbi:hypothetical protein ACFL6L_01665 [candidate division KSB1 bacterium]
MASSQSKNDRLVTRAIIITSLTGILYFGYQAISGLNDGGKENPFEYNIENFKKSDAELLHYSETSRIPLEFQHVTGIAVGVDDNIFIAGDKSVLIMNNEGQLQSVIPTNETAYCLAVDKSTEIYLGMRDHIEVYNMDGTRNTQWESLGDRAQITSIAVSDEYLFAADAGNHIVWKYDKNGNILSRIGEENETKDIPGFIIPSPYFDVSIDPDGFLWAVNTGRHSLENYTMDGGLRSFWGEYSMEIEGFCGCCNPTHITILDDGKFVTSEKGIARIKVYNRLGILESVVAGSDQFSEGTEGLDLALDSRGRIYVIDPGEKAVRIFEKTKDIKGENEHKS